MKFITLAAGLFIFIFLFLTTSIFIEPKQFSSERMAEAEFMQLSRSLGQKSLEEKTDPHSNNTYPSAASSDWYVQAQQSIAESEYEINWQAGRGVYSSPNRSHNLRFDYYPDGFTASPREHPDWSVKLTLDAYGKGNLEEYQPGQFSVSQNTASSHGEVIDIFYKNTKDGMRQDFLVKEKPNGSGMLKLILNVETQLDYAVTIDARGLGFTDTQGQLLYRYNDLRVTDATGRELVAGMEKTGNDLTLVVNDLEAIYPVLIDPLSTTADWTAESDQVNGWFGVSVSTAGDVNGDGYSDVIVGAYGYDNGQSDEGRAYVYLGSSAGLSSTPSWTTESNQASARLGVSVASAGDVNGDGFSDVIVGAYLGGQDSEGQAYVYLGGVNGLSTTAAWVAESNQANAQFGISVASAGDVNGDGFSDVIVGSDFYDNGEGNEGRAYVYHGSSTGLSPNAAWTAESDQESAQFGGSVTTAGDVNGDGYADVIVGAELFDSVSFNEGKVYVYHGSANGLSQTASWTAISDQASAFLGNSVSTAGDVNGDGYSDIIVGAQSYNNGESDEGRAYVYHGSATGLNITSAWTAESNQATAYFGYNVSTAGDVNGDGYADVMVAAYLYDNGQTNEGRVYVYLGGNTGVSLSADWTAESDQPGGTFGRGISTAGDINGDGFSDIIVGSFFYDNGEDNEGRAYVYMGGSAGLGGTLAWTARSNQVSADFGYSVSTAGDVNGDGYSDVIVGAARFDNGETEEGRAYLFLGSATGLETSAVWTAESNQATAYFAESVASAGDVNGDGYSDVIIGADRYDNGETNEGRAYIYLGNSMALSSTPDWTFESNISIAFFGNSVATAGDVNGDGYSDVIVGAAEKAYIFVGSASGPSLTPWIVNSDQGNSSFGSSVSSAGDVNGDGYSDVIVGAAAYDNGNGQADEGRAYMYLGSSNGPSTTAAWTAESNQAGAQFGKAVASAGDVNGDGYSDVIVGAPYFDNGQSNEGRVYVFLGSASGLALTAAWTVESDQASTEFGMSVSSAGDINGDGYSDVIVGAPLFDNGEADEGQAFVYRGSALGLSVTSFLTPQSDQSGATFGWCVSSAGDVNGDGFSDILIGAYQFDNLQTDEGQIFLYYGATGVSPVTPRLLRDNLTTSIAPLGRTHSISSVGARLFANKSIMGRAKVKAQFEVKPLGTAFNAINLSESANWSDTGISGIAIQKTITGLSSGERYKLRMRLHYLDSYFPYSRWIYLQGNGGLGETDFIVSNVDNSTQPATQASNLSFSAITENSLNLQWTSGNGTSRIVVARAGQAVDAVTWDGKVYTASSVFGSGSQIAPGQYVVYKGNGNTATITGLSANTTYHFRVFEFTGTGGLENYNAATATGNPNNQLTATTAPVLESASAVGQTSFQLSWGAVTGATNYSLDVSANNFSTFVSGYSGKVLGNVTTTSVTGLPSGTNYQARLRAVNGAGPSANSNIQTALTIPGTPNLNTTTGITASTATINWNAVAGSTNFLLELSTDNFSNITAGYPLSVPGPTSHTVTGLLSAVTYQARVRAQNATGVSPNSNAVSFTTLAVEPVAQPTALLFSNVNTSSMSVNFTSASGAPTGYLVLFQSGSSPTVPPADGTNYTVGDNLGSGKVAYVGSATNFSISNLLPATVYYFDVYAYNGNTGTYNYLGTSPLEGNKSTLALPPTNQTSSVTVAGITTTTNSVSYLSSGSANYLVLRYTDAAPSQLPANGTPYPALTTLGNSTVVYSGNALGFSDSGLSAGTGYKYAVLSYNGTGESSHYLTMITAQNSTSFITLPAAPVASPASSVGNTSFIANWNPVTGGFTYELEVSSDDFVSLLSGFPKTAITAFEYTVTGLTTNTTYKYRVKAANANGGLSAFSNTVTVATNSTSNPLKINTTPISATLLSGFGSTKLTVNVSGGSGTKSVKLQYRKITDAVFTPLPCTLKSGDDYEVTVTESLLDELGMEYYFEATDGGGASVSQSAHSYLYYRITQGSANSSIPFTSGFNGQSSSYKMFSIPYVLDDKNFESIFDEMGAYNKEVWRLFSFDPTSESYKEFAAGLSNNIESGKSYWFNAASDLKESIQVGAGTVTQANQSTPFTLQLSPGWNQIGNPYPFNVDWAAIQSLNASVGLNSLWLFEGGGYVKKNVLASWKGAFVYADNGGTVTFPVTSRTTSPGRIASNDLSLDIDENAWQLPLTLTHQDMIHSGAIGMHPLATESKDRFDEITVPRFIDYVEMYTTHPEYRSSKFSSDIIPSTSSRTWQFNLTSNQEVGSATLAWDHLTLGKSQSHIMLIDDTDQVWLDMKKVGQYSFSWKNDRQVTLLYARQGDIDPGITLLGQAFPNPFADQVSFPLLIDADHLDAVVEIYDLMGRKIRSLHHAFPSAGVYEIQWDGKDYSGQEVVSGMLIYRLAGSTQSKRIIKQ